ncbi:MAG TPA: hypothetical protein VMV17_07905 [Streptosporangiaceae bacterium]|nr:hypothetical protein [Streptosporangiaceae bacterium]
MGDLATPALVQSVDLVAPAHFPAAAQIAGLYHAREHLHELAERHRR